MVISENDLYIDTKVVIRRSVREVFDSLKDPLQWNKWFTTECQFVPIAGSKIEFLWRDFGADKVTISDEGSIVDLVPERVFAFTWMPGEKRTTVRIELSDRGGRTLLHLSERGFGVDDFIAFKDCCVGWGEALTSLKVWLEHEISLSSP